MKLRRRDTLEELELEPGQVLGRAGQADHRLEDGSVSRRHARVEERAGQLWLVDLGSSNGTRWNGRRVRELPLRPGDLVTFGVVACEVLGEAAASAPEAAVAPTDVAREERARLRAELRTIRRMRGLGDLDQQPLAVQLLAVVLGLALVAGVAWLVIFLGDLIAPR